MFKEFIYGFWVVVQLIFIFFKLAVAENVSWWIVFSPIYFIIISYGISELVKEIKK